MIIKNKLRVVVLGAGFGGLELSTILSEKLGERLDLTLIDRNNSFFFGFSKLDVMFGRRPVHAVKIPYTRFKKKGVTFRQELITSIDPITRKVTTQNTTYETDVLVIALGADYDMDATLGLSEAGNEFYSFEGAMRIGEILPTFKKGNVIVGVTGFPFKCPPAPSEVAILLDEYLTLRGIRDKCNIQLVVPFELPIPPSFGMSKSLLTAFDERNIEYIPEIMVGALDPERKLAILDDGTELPFDLFLGVPEHRVPRVVEESGLLFDEWVPVNKRNLKTKFSNVYAIGDVTSVGTPKAGIFAEGAARIVAESILAEFEGKEYNGSYDGVGSCYIEFGGGKVGKVDVSFLSDSESNGVHHEASKALAESKKEYELSRLARWFGDADETTKLKTI